MKQHGRRIPEFESITSVAVAPDDIRPSPPDDFTEDEIAEWWLIVNRFPADRFKPDSWSMLAILCSQLALCRNLNALIRTIDFETQLERLRELEDIQLVTITTICKTMNQLRFLPPGSNSVSKADRDINATESAKSAPPRGLWSDGEASSADDEAA